MIGSQNDYSGLIYIREEVKYINHSGNQNFFDTIKFAELAPDFLPIHPVNSTSTSF